MINDPVKIIQHYHIEDGPLAGTILKPFMAFLLVQYPGRKSTDCYIPPMVNDKKHITHPWACCQPNCLEPQFIGDMPAFIEHLKLHMPAAMKRKLKCVSLKSR